jgi:hypothetical protein
MGLIKFQDSVYLEYKRNWFVWESSWDIFRPVTSVSWNGSRFVLEDDVYVSDITSPLYGFGTTEMKEVCKALTQLYRDTLSNAPVVRTPEIGNTEWFFDRFVSFTQCAPRDKSSWKRMSNARNRTLRKGPSARHTRRSVRIYE